MEAIHFEHCKHSNLDALTSETSVAGILFCSLAVYIGKYKYKIATADAAEFELESTRFLTEQFLRLLLRHVTARQEEGSVNEPLSALKTEPIKGAKPFTPVRHQRS